MVVLLKLSIAIANPISRETSVWVDHAESCVQRDCRELISRGNRPIPLFSARTATFPRRSGRFVSTARVWRPRIKDRPVVSNGRGDRSRNTGCRWSNVPASTSVAWCARLPAKRSATIKQTQFTNLVNFPLVSPRAQRRACLRQIHFERSAFFFSSLSLSLSLSLPGFLAASLYVHRGACQRHEISWPRSRSLINCNTRGSKDKRGEIPFDEDYAFPPNKFPTSCLIFPCVNAKLAWMLCRLISPRLEITGRAWAVFRFKPILFRRGCFPWKL